MSVKDGANREDATGDTVLVIGATGRVGGAFLAAMDSIPTDERPTVRCLARNSASADRLRADGRNVVIGDLAKPETLLEAIKGANCICLITPDGPKQVEMEQTVYTAALRTGGVHVVKLSAITAKDDVRASFGILHGESEDLLRASGLPFTILRPSMFFESLELFSDPVIKAGKIIVPSGDGAVSLVSLKDVGRCLAAVCAETSAHGGKIYTLTGPEAFSMGDIAKALSEKMERDIRHISPPTFIARLMLRFAAGMDRWMARMVTELFVAIRSGAENHISTDVETLLGRPSEDLSAYLARQNTFR